MSDWPRSGEQWAGRGSDHPAGVDLAKMRLEYETAGLDGADMAPDPVEQFDRWMAEAIAADLYEPNAMVVSTVDPAGQPWSRTVLLKGVSTAGFDFYTNYGSHKSNHLDHNPKAAATIGWLGLHRQVNLAGGVERISAEESDRYWSVRTRGSQLGAWASEQSQELVDRDTLLRRYDEAEARFPDEVARPEHWGGWRIVPHTIEFWQGRRNRLHDRLRFRLDADGAWGLVRLSP